MPPTYSRSKDTSSADPGSTAGGGKPDVPNAGFVVQGDQRDLDANYALSDFDRPHRFSSSFICELPGVARGFRVSRGSCRCSPGCRTRSTPPSRSSRTPASTAIWSADRAASIASAFGRPSLCGSLDDLRRPGVDPTEAAFNKSVLCSPTTAAGGYPAIWASAISVATCCAASGSAASISASRRRSAFGGLARRRAAVGRLQRVQHRQLRAAQQRDRWRRPTSARSPTRSAVRA